MGMAASQVRLLQLTGRDHDIDRELLHLSNQKTELARNMDAVTLEYQKALSAKTIKWSNNSGVTYTDLTYSTLMKPNANNMKSPILITDSSGKIVLNKQYQKYAQMLDEAGGCWGGDIRYKILSELTGISQSEIEAENSFTDAAIQAANDYNTALENLGEWQRKETEKRVAKTEYLNIDKLEKKLGISGECTIFSEDQLKSLADSIKNSLSKYFVDDEVYLGVKDKTAFEEACDSFASTYAVYLNNTGKDADEQRQSMGITGSNGFWKIDISQAFASIMDIYRGTKGGSFGENDATGKVTYPVRDTSSSEWSAWYEELKIRYNAVESAKQTYTTSIDSANQILTAEQESQLKYYDLLFQAIADNGWVYDAQVDDSDYLNQMFQNNAYFITTITENKCFNENLQPSINNSKFLYDTTLASNFDNIFFVNDSDIREEALVNYEHKKRQINAKETKIDLRMENLKTEQATIQKFIESIDKVKNDNIERTFKLWG